MLVVYFGTNTIEVRKRAHAYVDARRAEGLSLTVLVPEMYTPGLLRDQALATSLFGETRCVLLDTFSEMPEALSALTDDLELLARSEHHFVVIEDGLLASSKKIFQKHATECIEVTADATSRFNTFALAEALSGKDKKTLWILLRNAAQNGVSFEEIVGVLFWQLKSIRLAHLTKTPEEAGMKPFVYKKAKNSVISSEEAVRLSRALLHMYHEAHLGKLDGEMALEKLVLSL